MLVLLISRIYELRPYGLGLHDIVTRRSAYRRGVKLAIRFINHLYKWPVTASNCSPIAYLHSSQINTAPANPFLSFCVSTSHSLPTASNSGASSVSRCEVLSSQNPVENWLGRRNCLPYNSSTPTTQKDPVSKNTSIVARRCFAAGTCLPRCWLRNVSVIFANRTVITALHATIFIPNFITIRSGVQAFK
jgi:hypothetical protein